MAREDYTHKMVDGKRVDLTSDEIDELVKREEDWAAGAAARAWASLRTERDGKLAATDWMAGSDLTLADNWKTYRQALRDLPASYNDTTVQGDITWPSEPS
tara:strand:+ start:372 stop:674 length:303 start_codon:yes stop_codon:yes gene_type:complete